MVLTEDEKGGGGVQENNNRDIDEIKDQQNGFKLVGQSGVKLRTKVYAKLLTSLRQQSGMLTTNFCIR